MTDVNLSYTANECKLYVNKFYSSFLVYPGTVAGHITRTNQYTSDMGTDNLFHVYYDENQDLIPGLHIVPSSGGGWSVTEWGNIRSVNFLLDNYTVSEEIDAAEKYVAEARFFRAYFYFEQFLSKFGGSPWIDHTLTTESEELALPRLKRNELADKIIADLDWAINKLPSFPKQETGRISKEVAQLYKARVALYEGTWEKYHAGTPFAGEGNPTEYFKIARDATNEVISTGIFGLDNVGKTDGYFKLFNQRSYIGSKEVMFWKEYNRSFGVNKLNGSVVGGGGVGLTKRLVDSYLCIDGKPISESSLYQGDDNLLKVAKNRDPRLSQTMFLPGRPVVIIGEKDTSQVFTKPEIYRSVDYSRCSTGYELCKGSVNSFLTQAEYANLGTQDYINTAEIIYRYAEVLLIYAEARAELGEITQADLDISINVLRDRVGMPHLKISVGADPIGDFTAARGYSGVPVSNLLQEIRRERRVELACEGFRMDDLKRWAAANLWNYDKIQGAKTAQFKDLTWLRDYFSANQNLIPQSMDIDQFISAIDSWEQPCVEGSTYFTDDEGYNNLYQPFIPSGHFSFDPNKAYLAPIPLQELLLNNTLEQNPGWGE